jgi:uncharacterized protein YdeI (YjbR/CyaY-like superfamily)
MRDRKAAGVKSGDVVQVTLELDDGYREVAIPKELVDKLNERNLMNKFRDLTYSKRKEFVRLVAESKAVETRLRRIDKIVTFLEKNYLLRYGAM